MQLYAIILFCTIITGCYGTSFAALLGSSRPEVQENFQRLIKTNECPACDLAGVVLTRVDLSEANLEGANLAGAKLNLANLSGANLKNANLQGAGLGGADFANADLRGANLTGAVLGGAYFEGALLDGQIVTEQPYEAEELPDVSETKYVAEETRSKPVPYTRDLATDNPGIPETVTSAADEQVIEESSLAVEQPPDIVDKKKIDTEGAGTEKSIDEILAEPAPDTYTRNVDVITDTREAAVEIEATDSYATEKSKTLTPIADVVVHTSTPIVTAEMVEQVSVPEEIKPVAETAEKPGFWDSVSSFFGGGSTDNAVDEKTSSSVPQEQQQEVLVQPVEEVVVSQSAEKVLLLEEVQAEPEAVTEIVAAEEISEQIPPPPADTEPVMVPELVVAVEQDAVTETTLEVVQEQVVEENVPASSPADEIVVSRTVEVVSSATVPTRNEQVTTIEIEQEMPVAEETVTEKPVEVETVIDDIAPVEVVSAEETGQDIVPVEQAEESGFWDSITSIFSSSDDKETVSEKPVDAINEQEAHITDEVVAETSVISLQDAPPVSVTDTSYRKMNPAEEMEQVEPVAQDTVTEEETVIKQTEDMVTGTGETIADSAATETRPEEAVVAETKQGSVAEIPEQEIIADNDTAAPEESTSEEPVADSVSDMIALIEADQVPEPTVTGDVLYTVETPEQAMAKQQMLIDRLLDEDRCVACDLPGVDLSGKNLDKIDLERSNLQGANLEGIDLKKANLKGTNFSGANLKDADLRKADLYLADFTDADLTGANFEGTLIDSTDFTNAKGLNLEGAIQEE